MSPAKCRRCKRPHVTRTGAPACTGHISSGPRKGEPCANPPLRGADVCRYHGGAAGQVRAAAAARAQEAAAAAVVHTLGLQVDISPTEALLEEVRWTAGHVHWLRGKVQELHDDRTHVVGPDGTWEAQEVDGASPLVWGTTKVAAKGSGQFPGTDTVQTAAPSVWYQLYARERQHLVAVCAAALKAGVEERRVRLAEQQGDLVAEAIRRILDALNLTPEQQTLVSTVVPAQLRLIAGGTP